MISVNENEILILQIRLIIKRSVPSAIASLHFAADFQLPSIHHRPIGNDCRLAKLLSPCGVLLVEVHEVQSCKDDEDYEDDEEHQAVVLLD